LSRHLAALSSVLFALQDFLHGGASQIKLSCGRSRVGTHTTHATI
jgi:hypothetical protein